ncbi:hypothetical protein G7Y89_g12799 [Cudoniella acicularis]|uniref:Kinetochore protein mis13 n=1 Tax=Cudoniella acicularis TaxID=354080 RepID=A0A8H4RAJ3_9HELO|nr:hypothetical protein G7Y89_g12799 [Cudoniella acicularis]
MSQPTGRRRSKRLAAYDEEDGDFVFTRGSKRTKTAPEAPEPAPAPAPSTAKRGRKPKERDHEEAPTVSKSQGRQMNFSTPKVEENEIRLPKRRKSTRNSTGKAGNGENKVNASAMETTDYDSIDLVGSTAEETNKLAADGNSQSTMITLPFSDTPVINRNKEMRKKGANTRRSSLGLRGRRASSLIDNGHSAIPHREVDMSEFYKHIEADGLVEPRRMKQVLTWSGERVLGEKPSHGEANDLVDQAARTIKEGLLKDFANKSEYSDWFSREETAPRKVVKKPNPRNIEIEENLAGLEARVQKLKEERNQWKALAKPPPPLPPIFPDDLEEIDASQIDDSLLDPEQAAILATISSSSARDLQDEIAKQVQELQAGLEFQVDQFTDGVHKLEQYKETAGRAASKILSISAVRLEERDRKEKEAVEGEREEREKSRKLM